jgi:hypothetical protein
MKILNFKKPFALLLIQLFFFLPAESQNIEDNNLLKTFLKDLQQESKQDSIFIDSRNSNAYIIQNFEYYLALKRDSFIKMPYEISQKINDEIKFVAIKKGDSNYQRLLTKPWVSIKPDSLVHRVYSDKEYEHFKKQVVDGEWQLDFSDFDGMFNSKDSQSQKMVFYMSKPIYTIDDNFALIYMKSKKNARVFIYIYKKDKMNSWNRVYVIPHNFISQ